MNDQIYDIIAKKLSGESSGQEEAQLQDWLATDPLHVKEYEEIRMLWNDADEVLAQPEFNTAAAWEKVGSKIGVNATSEPGKGKGRVIRFSPAVKLIAAAAVVLLGVFLLRPFTGDGMMEVVAANSNESITLPDNSHVVLRKGSTLRYPSKFKGDTRQIALQGEAFFDVTRNEQKPFIIDAQAVEVRVVGTSFNVSCGQDKAIVTVATGKVQVSKGKDKVVLEKGQEGVYKGGTLIKGDAVGNGAMYWQTGTVKYELIPLATVVGDLEKILEVKIKFDISISLELQEKPITIEFKKATTEQILDELCLITGYKWHRIKDEYIISKT